MAQNKVALIVGVTGMVGLSLVNSLKRPTPAGSRWTVYGVARRFFPVDQLDEFIRLDVLDRAVTLASLAPLACQVTHLYWVTLQERDSDDTTSDANSAMLTNVLDALTMQRGSRLCHVALQTGTKHYYWGMLRDQVQINSYVPFQETSPRNKCRLFYYDLEDILVNYSSKLTWSVHRPSVILGASDRTLYNVLLTLATYALICKHEQTPFLFPGTEYTWHHFCDVSDADLLAEQQIWAGSTPRAHNQAFNCTNGDVFTWRSFWKVLCELFHVEFIECRPTGDDVSDWVTHMMEKEHVWDEIVEDNGLCGTKLREVTCYGAVHFVLNFRFQNVSCMNKSREFGFCESVDTLKSVKKWVFKLREMNIIPIV